MNVSEAEKDGGEPDAAGGGDAELEEVGDEEAAVHELLGEGRDEEVAELVGGPCEKVGGVWKAVFSVFLVSKATSEVMWRCYSY